MLSPRTVSFAFTGLVACLVLLPPTATHAKCARWDLSHIPAGVEWGARQSNGFTLGFMFRQQDTNLQGAAEYWPEGKGNNRMGGTIAGSIKGSAFRFTVRWNNGATGDYSGWVNDDGTIEGATFDSNGRTATWTGDKSQKATCLEQTLDDGIDYGGVGKQTGGGGTHTPAPSTQGTPSAGTCTVFRDTKVFDKPDGVGTAIGELKAPTAEAKLVKVYTLVEPCRENWCHLKGSGVPTGEGWVFTGPEYRCLKCT